MTFSTDTSSAPRFSLLVPTRKRPDRLRAFLNSVADTAEHPGLIEVVLVIDEDDPDSLSVTSEGLSLTQVIVPPGLSMGSLNSAGYQHSRGGYLMLLNDDVLCRTKGWDTSIYQCCQTVSDEILFVHVNDTLMQTELCTFPLVSRRVYELAREHFCPPEYRRYRIDDHIEDLFNLLGVLGEQRSIYLPGVVFEHQNYVEHEKGLKQYFSEEKTLALDAPAFARLLPMRKEAALKLMSAIHPSATEPEREQWRNRLNEIEDSFALRKPERLRYVTDFSEETMADLRARIRAGAPGPKYQPPRKTAKEILLDGWKRVRARAREDGLLGLMKAVGRRTAKLFTRYSARRG